MDLLIFAAGALLIALAVRWWRGEPSWSWIAGYALLVLGFFAAPLATPRVQVPTDLMYRVPPWAATVPQPVEVANPLLSDVPHQMLPFRTLVRRRLLALDAPLWANELGTGQPLLGNAQSAPFAPLHLMALALPPLRGMTVATAWQVFLALLLMHALALALTRRPPPRPWTCQAGAALAAVSFAFSTFSVVWLYYPIGMTAMWLPGVMLGIVALARGERRAFPGLVAAAVGMALSGHPETLGHAAVASAGLGLVLLAAGPRPGRGRFVLRAAGAVALAGCLAAPALLPVLDVLPSTVRMALLSHGGRGLHPRPPDLRMAVPLVEPLIFGSPRDGDWQGPTNFHNDCSEYAGAVVVALAVAGALTLGGRILALVLAGAGALLVALGVPPFFELFSSLPGMGLAVNSRLRLFWVLATALAAGLAVPELARRRAGRWTAAASLAAVFALVAWLRPPLDGAAQRLWWTVVLAGLAATLATLAMPRWRPALAAVALLAVGADLVTLGVRYYPLVPPGRQLEAPAVVARLASIARFPEAASAPPGAAGLPSPPRVTGEGWTLSPYLAAFYGLWDPRGNDPMEPFRSRRLMTRRLSHGHPDRHGHARLIAPFDLPALRMLGVRYLLTAPSRRLPPPWRRAFRAPDGAVWRVPGALDLFFVPRRVQPVADAAAARAASSNQDFAELAVYEGPGGAPDRAPPGPAAAQRGRLWLRALRPNGFEMVTESRNGMVVASSVSDVPGWRVRIDDRPASPPLRVNWAFLGFRAPPGVHRVELEYRPRGWTRGWALFWLAAGIAASSAAWRRRRRATATSGGPPPAAP